MIRKSLLCFVLFEIGVALCIGIFIRGYDSDKDSQMRRLRAAFRDLNFSFLLRAFLLSHRQHLSNNPTKVALLENSRLTFSLPGCPAAQAVCTSISISRHEICKKLGLMFALHGIHFWKDG